MERKFCNIPVFHILEYSRIFLFPYHGVLRNILVFAFMKNFRLFRFALLSNIPQYFRLCYYAIFRNILVFASKEYSRIYRFSLLWNIPVLVIMLNSVRFRFLLLSKMLVFRHIPGFTFMEESRILNMPVFVRMLYSGLFWFPVSWFPLLWDLPEYSSFFCYC